METNLTSFGEKFLQAYLGDGFGRLSKRDIEILVFHLLMQEGQFDLPRDMFKVSRELKLTETKVRNLYQEAQIKYCQYDEVEAKRRFVKLVSDGLIECKGNRLILIVRDPLLRQYFEEWVANHGGFTDSSFNKNLVTIHQGIFIKVLEGLADFDMASIQPKLKGNLAALENAQDRPGLIRLFSEEFFKAAGKETGAMTVRGVAAGLKLLILSNL